MLSDQSGSVRWFHGTSCSLWKHTAWDLPTSSWRSAERCGSSVWRRRWLEGKETVYLLVSPLCCRTPAETTLPPGGRAFHYVLLSETWSLCPCSGTVSESVLVLLSRWSSQCFPLCSVTSLSVLLVTGSHVGFKASRLWGHPPCCACGLFVLFLILLTE